MFIGTSEKLKQKIREFNANSGWFIFSQGDLQPDYNAISGKRYSIVSPELKRKLGEIISQRRTAEDNISSSPAIIEVKLTLDPQQNKASYGSLNYHWWFVVKKSYIYQQARNSGGNVISFLSNNDQERNWKDASTENLAYILGSENYRYSDEWVEIRQIEREWRERERHNFWATRRSAQEEIRNKIREANMDLAEVFATGGEYFDLQPSYCFCGNTPNEQAEWYWDHIGLCLDREEKIREFKNEIMNIVERSVGQFNQRRQQVIDQAKQEAQNKGVQLGFDFWERVAYECRNSERLNDLQRQLNDLIRNLTNIGEQARQEREKMTQEEAQAQQDQAQREREEQERREREREERDRQREEELQSEQEERSRETEDNFKFKDAEITREKEALEQKLDDLKKKLNQPENQDQTDNSDYENEKKDLEKKLWDLRMNNFTSDPSPNDRDNNPPPPPSEEPKISTKKAESKLNWLAIIPAMFIVGGIVLIFLRSRKGRKNK